MYEYAATQSTSGGGVGGRRRLEGIFEGGQERHKHVAVPLCRVDRPNEGHF